MTSTLITLDNNMTIKKAGYRSMPVISRDADNVENSSLYPKWMSDFAQNLSKVSVQPYRPEDNIFDQISSIINSSKPKYSSVEDAVREMQERSGITAYKKDLKSLAETIKQAAEQEKIKIFELKPQIKSTVDNCLEDTKGNLPIPAVIERIRSIHKNDIDDDAAWDDENLLKYINDKSIEIRRNHPNHDDNYTTLGKLPNYDSTEIDKSNTDALISLTPTVLD
jgi:cobalamin biosynthesis protein CobT